MEDERTILARGFAHDSPPRCPLQARGGLLTSSAIVFSVCACRFGEGARAWTAADIFIQLGVHSEIYSVVGSVASLSWRGSTVTRRPVTLREG